MSSRVANPCTNDQAAIPGAVGSCGSVSGDHLGERPVQGSAGGAPRLEEHRVSSPVELRAEHHLEVGTVVDGEANVGHPHLEKAPGLVEGGGEPGGEQSEPVNRDGGEETGLVAEVVGRGRVGDVLLVVQGLDPGDADESRAQRTATRTAKGII